MTAILFGILIGLLLAIALYPWRVYAHRETPTFTVRHDAEYMAHCDEVLARQRYAARDERGRWVN